MTISTTNFPTWFFTGFYGGLACCALTMVISLRAMYAHIGRRGMTRRLFLAVVISIVSAICLLPPLVWFQLHFNRRVSPGELTLLACCVVFFGWLLPIGTTVISVLVSRSPFSTMEEQAKQAEGQWSPPRYQSGMMAPFVFSAETPWGWLEYRTGNFLGQRLALKRSIITLGRAEDSDIWLDDDMASRRHAEVAWHNNVVYLTDCESLNTTCLNGQQVRGSVLLDSEDMIEIGTQRFLFILAEPKMVTTDQYDPLVNHKWRSSSELQDSREITQYKFTVPRIQSYPYRDQINTESKAQQVGPEFETPKWSAPAQGSVPVDLPLSDGQRRLRLPSRPKES